MRMGVQYKSRGQQCFSSLVGTLNVLKARDSPAANPGESRVCADRITPYTYLDEVVGNLLELALGICSPERQVEQRHIACQARKDDG